MSHRNDKLDSDADGDGVTKGYRLTDLTFSYDGAPMDENCGPFNPCPRCSSQMSWHDLRPFVTSQFLECEDCDLLCDLKTEQVWMKDETPRHPMVIVGALRERIEAHLRIDGRTHVSHTEQCARCGQKAFHLDDCPEIEASP